MAQHSEVTVGLQQLEGEEETAQSLDLRQAWAGMWDKSPHFTSGHDISVITGIKSSLSGF